jgi:hypothetical protein
MIMFKIPSGKWKAFKREVMGFWFKSAEPCLTRYTNVEDAEPGYEYAGFSSDYPEDIAQVKRIAKMCGI